MPHACLCTIFDGLHDLQHPFLDLWTNQDGLIWFILVLQTLYSLFPAFCSLNPMTCQVVTVKKSQFLHDWWAASFLVNVPHLVLTCWWPVWIIAPEVTDILLNCRWTEIRTFWYPSVALVFSVWPFILGWKKVTIQATEFRYIQMIFQLVEWSWLN